MPVFEIYSDGGLYCGKILCSEVNSDDVYVSKIGGMMVTPMSLTLDHTESYISFGYSSVYLHGDNIYKSYNDTIYKLIDTNNIKDYCISGTPCIKEDDEYPAINLGWNVKFGNTPNTLITGEAEGGKDLYVGSGGQLKARPSNNYALRNHYHNNYLDKTDGFYNLGDMVYFGNNATDLPQGDATGGWDLYVGGGGQLKRRPQNNYALANHKHPEYEGNSGGSVSGSYVQIVDGSVNLGTSVYFGNSATSLPQQERPGGRDLYVGSGGQLKIRPQSYYALATHKHSEYLTAHQSLNGYATQQWVKDQGYIKTHQSLAAYATQQWVTNQGYLKSHQSLANYITKSGGTFTGAVTFNGGASTTGTTTVNPSATFKDIKILGRIKYDYTTATTGTPLVVNSRQNTICQQTSSSMRYKDIEKKYELSDIEKLYNIEVYNAKYKSWYLEESDELYNTYMPMFIAENIEEYLPQATLHNQEGLVEDWNYRVIIPAMFAMIKSQKEEIDKLKKQVNHYIDDGK